MSAPTGKAQDAVSPGRGEKAAPAAEAQAPKRDAKSSARPQSPARDNAIPADGKDIGTARGAKEQGARGSAREHADKPSTRDSRHATAATARSPDATSDRGKDDLAAARAAALERKQSTNGDASAKAAHQRRASPSKGEKSKRDVREKDVVAYGVAPTAGTKRRAADATKPADLR